ncbi:MAG TPA: hypothetical protein VLX92_08880 [Kofleriaceae bacterium]|nr:hypothetical protein [Kofleriaceae bacterium]
MRGSRLAPFLFTLATAACGAKGTASPDAQVGCGTYIVPPTDFEATCSQLCALHDCPTSACTLTSGPGASETLVCHATEGR